jgi:transposase-like protein
MKHKAKLAQVMVIGDKTVAQIASEFGVHPNQIQIGGRSWKRIGMSMR